MIMLSGSARTVLGQHLNPHVNATHLLATEAHSGCGTLQDLGLCQYFLRRHADLSENVYENLR